MATAKQDIMSQFLVWHSDRLQIAHLDCINTMLAAYPESIRTTHILAGLAKGMPVDTFTQMDLLGLVTFAVIASRSTDTQTASWGLAAALATLAFDTPSDHVAMSLSHALFPALTRLVVNQHLPLDSQTAQIALALVELQHDNGARENVALTFCEFTLSTLISSSALLRLEKLIMNWNEAGVDAERAFCGEHATVMASWTTIQSILVAIHNKAVLHVDWICPNK